MNDSLSLYISGPEQINDSISLTTYGGNGNNLRLFIQVDNPTTLSKNLGLNTYGSQEGETNSSQKSLALFTRSLTEDQFNLFVKVDEIGYFNFSKPLMILGNNKVISNNLNLFLQNNGISTGVSLLIKGLGENSGWYPNSNYMNMYIERDYEGLGNSINMYILSNEAFLNNIDLITYGKTTYNNSLNMFNVGGTATYGNRLNLYTHGF
jgi:hypothetical protein